MDLEKGIHTNGMQGQQEILSQKSVGYFHLCNKYHADDHRQSCIQEAHQECGSMWDDSGVDNIKFFTIQRLFLHRGASCL